MTRRLVALAGFGLVAAAAMSPASAAPMSDGPGVPKGKHSTLLQSVDAVSPSDVWAVGYRLPPCCDSSDSQTLAMHWDGAGWRTVPSFAGSGRLFSVAAVSSDDVWAVGSYAPSGGDPGSVLVLHWNGTDWRQVTTPKYPGTQVLTDVSFTSPDNVLATGYYYTDEGQPVVKITLAWDGSTWQEASKPLTFMRSIDALSPKSAWGVGYSTYPYAAHWNGKAWKERSPNPPVGRLTLVTAISSDDVWTTGVKGFYRLSFFEHWDGTSWTEVDDPHGIPQSTITGISGSADDDLWASGYGQPHGSQGFLEHWDGHTWADTAFPAQSQISQIWDVVAISRTDAWAVGFHDANQPPYNEHKILMHWDGTKWSSNTTQRDG